MSDITEFICRAHAKTTNNRCRKTTKGDFCNVHKSGNHVIIYPPQRVNAPAPVAQLPVKQAPVQQEPDQASAEEETIGEESYMGNPVLSIRKGKNFFNFGQRAAEAFIENIETIRLFVAGNPIKQSADLKLTHEGSTLQFSKEGKYIYSAGATKLAKVPKYEKEIRVWIAEKNANKK
jgi:hypothetical protein